MGAVPSFTSGAQPIVPISLKPQNPVAEATKEVITKAVTAVGNAFKDAGEGINRGFVDSPLFKKPKFNNPDISQDDFFDRINKADEAAKGKG